MKPDARKWTIRAGSLLLLAAVACAPAAPAQPTAAPAPAQPTTAPAQPAATTAPAPAAAPTAAPKPAATTAAAPAQPAAVTKDTWVIGMSSGPDVLDPTQSTNVEADELIKHMLEPLVEIGGPNLETKPALAERWETVNPTTWRFYLRKGVTFQNGDPFTADDVKFTFDLYGSPTTKNRAYVEPIASTKVIDPNTVEITTKEPFPGLLGNVVRVPILPAKYYQANKDGFATHPVGTGPYKFVSWQKDERLDMEANTGWWKGKPSPNKLAFRVIRDPSTRVAELRTGGVDIIQNVSLPQVKDVQDAGGEMVTVKGARVMIYALNQAQKPFDDIRVRQAVNYAVDRDAIVKSVTEGYGLPLASIFTAGWKGYDPNLKPYPYDPAKAKQMLADAGYPNGFTTTLNFTDGVFLKDKEVAEVIAAQLGQVGVKVNLAPADRNKLSTSATEGTWEGIVSFQWGTISEPDPMLAWVFMRDGNNAMGNEEIKKLIVAGRQETDATKRDQIYQQMYKLAEDQAPWLFINAGDDLWAKAKGNAWQPYHISGSKGYFWFFVPPA